LVDSLARNRGRADLPLIGILSKVADLGVTGCNVVFLIYLRAINSSWISKGMFSFSLSAA
jgi:hypothetical protein